MDPWCYHLPRPGPEDDEAIIYHQELCSINPAAADAATLTTAPGHLRFLGFLEHGALPRPQAN